MVPACRLGSVMAVAVMPVIYALRCLCSAAWANLGPVSQPSCLTAITDGATTKETLGPPWWHSQISITPLPQRVYLCHIRPSHLSSPLRKYAKSPQWILALTKARNRNGLLAALVQQMALRQGVLCIRHQVFCSLIFYSRENKTQLMCLTFFHHQSNVPNEETGTLVC